MKIGTFIHYIDRQGKEHNAQVVSVREVDGYEPIVTASWVNPATRKSEILSDLYHIDHPEKQETNPEMPTIHLHAWKHLDESHTAPAEDHPLFDHPHARPKVDDLGQIIPKARPKHEAMIAAYQRRNAVQGRTMTVTPVTPVTAATATVSAPVPEPEPHNPGNPQTVHFDFQCSACGRAVKRVASHQGGEQFEPDARDGKWEKHECSAADVKAHREKLAAEAQAKKNPQPPAKPAPSASEMLAAGWKPPAPEQPAATEQGEVDVIKELENAPPAPIEEKPPQDAA